jgi:hypothetical protein
VKQRVVSFTGASFASQVLLTNKAAASVIRNADAPDLSVDAERSFMTGEEKATPELLNSGAYLQLTVTRSKLFADACRLIVVLFVFEAQIVCGQSRAARTQTTATVNDMRAINRAQVGSVRLPPSIVPMLFGMKRVEVARVLEPLHLQPKFLGSEDGIALAQDPPAGTNVPSGSGVLVTLGVMPQLVLNGPAPPAYAGSELTFSVAFVPSLPAGPKAIYQFTWGDGSPVESTGNAVVTHRFAGAGTRVVSAIWTLSDRVKIGSARVVVDILPLPPPTPPSDTAQTATAVTTSSDTTATVATEVPTASETTGTPSSTMSSATTPEATTPPTTTTKSTTSTTTVQTSDSSSNPLVWIGAAAVVLLLVVTFLLARVLRALNRKPSETHVQAKSPVAFNGGVKSIEYEIEHPELIRRGPSVGLRGGVRAEEGGDV